MVVLGAEGEPSHTFFMHKIAGIFKDKFSLSV